MIFLFTEISTQTRKIIKIKKQKVKNIVKITKDWKIYLFCIFLCEFVGIVSAFFTREDVKIYGTTIIKPLLSPPSLIFPIVWTILYALMGISIAKIYLSSPSKEKTTAIVLFGTQLFLNFCWSFIFFSFQVFGIACFWLLALLISVIFMIIYFRKIDKFSGNLQIPYLIWLAFAFYLNISVYFLNRI